MVKGIPTLIDSSDDVIDSSVDVIDSCDDVIVTLSPVQCVFTSYVESAESL